jgi:hypothetical protein
MNKYNFTVIEKGSWTGPWDTVVNHIKDIYRIKPRILKHRLIGSRADFTVNSAKKRADIIRMVKKHFDLVWIEKAR